MNYKIIAKYIKNLLFEIPNPKTFFLLEKDISKYKINIDIKSNTVKENIIEVTLFPMNQNAQDLMMQAPSEVDEKQLKELGIKKDIKKS